MQDPQQLTASPFLIHPVESSTARLYREPVAVLDFASLYPSLFQAHNLCYTTLVHPDDVGQLPSDSLTITPTGVGPLCSARIRASWLHALEEATLQVMKHHQHMDGT